VSKINNIIILKGGYWCLNITLRNMKKTAICLWNRGFKSILLGIHGAFQEEK